MNVTIIVPSLDPDEKLCQVVEGLLAAGFRDIVLVNDGSCQDHLRYFETCARHPEVTVLTHEVNKGKGCALKTAFAWCLEHRPDIDGVVTVDGDNQHQPQDVRACAQAMADKPDTVWLGVRDFSLANVPFRSRFGNTLTRAIMRLACGQSITDTQTGLRAIPARYLPLMLDVPGERYEYETQMLLSLRDHKVAIKEVVITTVYIDENASSHFHPLRDSWKIYKIIFRHMFQKAGSFLKFSAISIICFLLDNGLFTLLNSLALLGIQSRELAATVGARLVSATVNFLLNRDIVFRSGKNNRRAAARYFLLAVAQCVLSGLLVSWLGRLFFSSPIMETVVKIPVDCLLFLLSYMIQKKWVFQP